MLHAEATSSDTLEGVAEFERWFSSIPGSDIDSSVRHEAFGNLRGLTMKNSGSDGPVITVPRSVVLQSDMNDPDWDAHLAKQLWRECSALSTSPLYGYCALLTKAWTEATDVPSSCAPNALRHWTDNQKQKLASKPAGQRILELNQQQESQWRRKFEDVDGLTWDQFQWAMEVVNSRAFCGEFGVGTSSLSPIISTVTPAIAAAAGATYFFQFQGQNDAVLIGLAAIASLPALYNLVNQSPPAAVLLPFIDSANHREDADSKIDYSPLSDAFTLSTGSQCLVSDESGNQLYISYGKKSDAELLLNYGFLEGVRLTGDDIDMDRQSLTEAFLARN